MNYDEVADRSIDLALGESRVRALWAEADALADLRRPYRKLELHLAADEPDFPGLVTDLESLLASRFLLQSDGVSDTERLAKQFDLRLGEPGAERAELSLTIILEQTSLLAKRPRAHVVPLLDKTNHLTHVMDFSRRKP